MHDNTCTLVRRSMHVPTVTLTVQLLGGGGNIMEHSPHSVNAFPSLKAEPSPVYQYSVGERNRDPCIWRDPLFTSR